MATNTLIPSDKELLIMVEKSVLCSDLKVSDIIRNIQRELSSWLKENNCVGVEKLYLELKSSEIF